MEEKQFTSDPKRVVFCRICALDGVDKRVEAAKLMGHIGGAHSKKGWNKSKYLKQWGAEAEQDFAFFKPSAKAVVEATVAIQKHNASQTPEAFDGEIQEMFGNPNKDLLTDDELRFYENFYALVLQAIDRDEVQMPVLDSLSLDMVILQRLRRKQLENTAKTTFVGMKLLEEAIEKAEKRIQSSMKTLCISREMLMKTREQIKSTAAGLISGYLDEIERQSPEALDAMMIDEKRVLSRMTPRIQKMLLDRAPEMQKEDEDEDDVSGTSLSLESALARAGVSF